MFANLLGRSRTSRFATQRGRARPGRAVLALQHLEGRCVPATFNVIGLGDGLLPVTRIGPNTFDAPTLRSAIEAANATPGNNTINLTVAGTYKITIPPRRPTTPPVPKTTKQATSTSSPMRPARQAAN